VDNEKFNFQVMRLKKLPDESREFVVAENGSGR